MKSKRNFLLLFLMLVATMSALRYLSGDQGTLKAVTLSKGVPQPRKQRAAERVLRRFDTKRRFCVGDDGARSPLFGPLYANLDARGNLYVIDFGDLGVKQYSPQGGFVRSFGRGKGQGPGEFMSISDLQVLPNGDVWVADFTGGKIEVFSPQGSLRQTLRLDRQPYRIIPESGGKFTLMLPLVSEQLFARFSADAKLQGEFGKLLDDRLNGLALDGWLGQADRGSLLYVPYYFGWIASYSVSGDLKFLVETIDRVPAPSVHRDSNGYIWVDPDTRVSAKSASLSGDSLYVLSGNDAGSRMSRMVDVYNAGDGSYRYSFNAPEPGTMALMQGDGDSLYMVKDTSVCRWTLRPAGETERAAR